LGVNLSEVGLLSVALPWVLGTDDWSQKNRD